MLLRNIFIDQGSNSSPHLEEFNHFHTIYISLVTLSEGPLFLGILISIVGMELSVGWHRFQSVTRYELNDVLEGIPAQHISNCTLQSDASYRTTYEKGIDTKLSVRCKLLLKIM